jgi:hypothetical protein
MAVHSTYQPTIILMVKFWPEIGKTFHFKVGTGTVCRTYRSSYLPTLLDFGLWNTMTQENTVLLNISTIEWLKSTYRLIRYDSFNLVLGMHNICYLWGMLPVFIIVYCASNFNGNNKDLGRLKRFWNNL